MFSFYLLGKFLSYAGSFSKNNHVYTSLPNPTRPPPRFLPQRAAAVSPRLRAPVGAAVSVLPPCATVATTKRVAAVSRTSVYPSKPPSPCGGTDGGREYTVPAGAPLLLPQLVAAAVAVGGRQIRHLAWQNCHAAPSLPLWWQWQGDLRVRNQMGC